MERTAEFTSDAPISFSDFELEEKKAIALATEPARKDDSKLRVRFSKHAELQTFESRRVGRKIFKDEIYIQIIPPGNRLTVIERKIRDDDKLRFPQQYTAFLQNLEQMSVGTPISDLTPSITPAQVLELKALKVDTVEQLAAVPDNVAQLLGTGGLELKKRAQKFLDKYANATEQGERIRSLEQQLAQLLADRVREREAADAQLASVVVNGTPLGQAAAPTTQPQGPNATLATLTK